MAANTATLFLLALVGGFLFAYRCHYTSYLAARVEGQRLLFFAAGYAVGLLALSLLTLALAPLVLSESWLSLIRRGWGALVAPVEHPALPAFFGAFAWAWVGAWIANRLYGVKKASDRAIERYGGETEKLLYKYMTSVELVSVTLDNRKVYIGWPTYTPSLRHETEDFRILPAVSGYRDWKTLELKFTTQYADILGAIEGDGVQNIDARDFEVVIPLDEVTSLGPFSLDIPQELFGMSSEEVEEAEETETLS